MHIRILLSGLRWPVLGGTFRNLGIGGEEDFARTVVESRVSRLLGLEETRFRSNGVKNAFEAALK